MSKRLCEKFLSINTSEYSLFLVLFITMMIMFPVFIGFSTLYDEKTNNFWEGFIFGETVSIFVFIVIFITWKICDYCEMFIKLLKKKCSKKHGVYYNEHRDF